MIIRIYNEIKPTFRVDESKETYSHLAYEQVYVNDFRNRADKTDEEIANIFFEATNCGMVAGYSGRSMSVGDIIEIDDHAYICRSIGWKKINWEKN